ncbi:MAG: hypothetical protein RIG77_15135 [Cyclobacteriaceae bacterium]
MKKLLNISLSFIIMMSTIGITISRHYCGEMLMAKSVILQADPCCDGTEMPEGCCHDESDSFSIEDDFHPSKIAVNQKLVAVAWFVFDQLFELSIDQDTSLALGELKESPPPIPETPIYLQVESFLI